MRIAIADDYRVVLSGLRELFADQGLACDVIGEAHTGGELLALLALTSWDLVITDFSMPDPLGSVDGLALLASLRERHPTVPVIVLTMVSHPALINDMLIHGALGVVSKRDVANELLQAIHSVTDGRIYLGARLHSHAMQATSAMWDRLSPREIDIVRWLGQGATITQIAQRTQRSISTIRQQKRSAMRKLGMHNLQHLRDEVRSMGLLS